jgi:hypothetical protein
MIKLCAGWPRNHGSVLCTDKTFFFTVPRPALRTTHPPIQWVLGAHSPGVKWLGHEADQSPPSGAEVKELTSTPPYVFMM